MRLSIRHTTRYLYPEPVYPNPHLIAMRPLDQPGRQLLSHSISVIPASRQHYWKDAFGNTVLSAFFSDATDQIEIVAEMEVLSPPRNPFDFIVEQGADAYPFSYNAADKRALAAYLSIGSPAACANVLPWIRKNFPTMPTRTLELLSGINERIHRQFRYQRRESPGIQTPDETIALGSGSCRDLAILMIECCRQLGCAARFVSGYLYHPPMENAAPSETLSLHAWMEVYLPGAGWLALDPTNGIFADAAFIACAVASEPHLASPVRGTYSHCKSFVPSKLEVSLTASPL